MNLVELRNKASEAMSVLGRKVRRIAEMDGKELGRNGGEVASSVEGILAEWDRYSEVKRQVASARSAAIIKKLGISFTEADMLCRDIDDQIEFLCERHQFMEGGEREVVELVERVVVPVAAIIADVDGDGADIEIGGDFECLAEVLKGVGTFRAGASLQRVRGVGIGKG